MTNTLKKLTTILLLLFLAPIIIATVQTPLTMDVTNEKTVEKKKEDIPVVYAAQIETPPVTESESEGQDQPEVVAEILSPPRKAFIYFTHWQEAYKPILAASGEKIEIYHPEKNITSFQEQITAQFAFHNVETEFLTSDNPHATKDYHSVRPLVQKALSQNDYDIVLDIHRDSAKAKVTTLKVGEESYAKIMLVVGGEHTNYKWNEQLANKLSEQMNTLVPGISRGVFLKTGKGVDGVYNQDLNKNTILIELGGIESTEVELNRTIAILAKAVSNVFDQQAAS
ncbi:MAG: stage II sporulation protein P [Psychrobacillus sp.]